MNKIKSDVIETINNIPDSQATSINKLLEAVFTRYQALEGLEDAENGNVMTIEELREDVANWK